MQKILFQGDSITDAGRSRERDDDTGRGYPTLVMGRLGYDEPGKYCFLNRGVSGNRIVDLYARIKVDLINIKPDVLSILIGVNDAWHEVNHQNGVSTEKYELIYDMLLREVKEALPGLQVMILEPFILPGTATKNTKERPERWQWLYEEVSLRAQAARREAQRNCACFVPLQERFWCANDQVSADYWVTDGVHPTAMGHELIARAWLEAFKVMRATQAFCPSK